MCSDHLLTPEIRLDPWDTAWNGLVCSLLLTWFDQAGRVLPWRKNKDPYRIWLSEIMLQQTQVQTVIPYYERFLNLWPRLADLAAADEEQVLKQWEGLGYYSRARNLHLAARQMMRDRGGRLPDTEEGLRRLPGIGVYSAGAILSIAFGQPVAAVDGNVVRVFSRLTATAWDPADQAERRLVRSLVEKVQSRERPGDFNEALMDLGATICLPRRPLCPECPLAGLCLARKTDHVDEFPLRKPAKAAPADYKTVLVCRSAGFTHVHRRPNRGLLAGLYEFDWLPAEPADGRPEQDQILNAWQAAHPAVEITALGERLHRFTHRIWNMAGYRLCLDAPILPDIILAGLAGSDHRPGDTGNWVTDRELAELPFPTALEAYRLMILAAKSPD
ncbi:MAG: A/G-specific adenine glycosylase [Clostridiaceae bacterium]|nr:A/G-specific adenine glycosylase [Clostridiaceae bacterium]